MSLNDLGILISWRRIRDVEEGFCLENNVQKNFCLGVFFKFKWNYFLGYDRNVVVVKMRDWCCVWVNSGLFNGEGVVSFLSISVLFCEWWLKIFSFQRNIDQRILEVDVWY